VGKVGAAKSSLAALPVGLRSQLSHFVARNPVDFTLRLSFCRFHGASMNEISDQNSDNKKTSKTIRFQGLEAWLRG